MLRIFNFNAELLNIILKYGTEFDMKFDYFWLLKLKLNPSGNLSS